MEVAVGEAGIVERERLNDKRRVNKFLEAVNQRLPIGGTFSGRVESARGRKQAMLAKYPRPVNKLIYAIDYALHRIWPKLPYLRALYFALTKGRGRVMSEMEANVTDMHKRINALYSSRKNLESVLAALPAGTQYDAVRKEATALISRMKTWDEEMVQRKAKAYDDVDNFDNKFTANYLFLLNQTESDIPQVNQSSLDRKAEMDAEWNKPKAQAEQFTTVDIPGLNKKLWELRVGAVR